MPDPTKERMWASFGANIKLDSFPGRLHTKLKGVPSEFETLRVVGGTTNWRVEGLLKVRKLKQRARIRYEIVEKLVPLIEEHASVGVEEVIFFHLDLQYFKDTSKSDPTDSREHDDEDD
tara:strand:+ start:2622 stop:2978 length:357 start_codon:yes stop_codon:yes gene_type:complete